MSFRGREERHRRRREIPSTESVSRGEGRRRDPRPRGRWLLVLAPLLLTLLAVGVFLLWRALGDPFSGTSRAEDSINAGSRPQVRIVNGRGQVRVEGAEALEDVRYEAVRYAVGRDPASARQRASEVPVNVSREGSAILIETGGGRSTGADYAVRVPSGATVEVELEVGDVEVSGLSGDLKVLAGNGDVTVRKAGGDIGIEAHRGDVSVSEINTETGRIELEVSSGDVDLRDLVVGTLEGKVEAGDVNLSGRFSGGGRVSVGTGSINVDLPPEDARDLSLEAGIGKVLGRANGEG